MRGWYLALAGLAVLGAAAGAAYFAWYQLPAETIEIEIADIVPGNFAAGKPVKCTIIGGIDNRTKFHIDRIGVEIAALHIEAADAIAWSKTDQVKLAELTLKPENDRTCSDILEYIGAHAASAYTARCALPGIAEGDCQKMVNFVLRVPGEKTAALLQLETRKLVETQDAVAAQMAPIDHAIARLHGKPGMNQIMDVLLRADSRSWSGSTYDAGSVHVTGIVRGAPGSYSQTFHGLYTYNGGGKGWVNVTVYRDRNAAPCLEFHSAPGRCRSIHIPSSMESTPPAGDPAGNADSPETPKKIASAAQNPSSTISAKPVSAGKCVRAARSMTAKQFQECGRKPHIAK